jgi:Flp pilus assembly protein TadD
VRGDGRAADDVRDGHDAQALAELDGVGGQASGRAAALRGRAYLSGHDYRHAAEQLSDATRRARNDWSLQRDYAIALRRLGEESSARAHMRRALALNPRMQLPHGFRVAKTQRPSRHNP